MVILETKLYKEIIDDVHSNGHILSIDVEEILIKKYSGIPRDTIVSIISQEERQKIKNTHHKVVNNCRKLLAAYEKDAKQTQAHNILLNMAIDLKFSPISLARIILNEKFKNKLPKSKVGDLLKNPNSINDPILACNVSMCVFNDASDGPITNIIRRCIGEEYEIRLKEMARSAGIIFFDENDLRRTGFDKTPDLKLAIPCLFRNKVIHWIESKALFGSLKVHQKYITEQLTSYSNRFGAGIVIYWHGIQDIVVDCKENGNLIIVTDSFPSPDELELLKFSNS